MKTSELKNQSPSLLSHLHEQALFILSMVGALWLIELLDFLSGQRLEVLFAIYPRDPKGLLGIPLAPFLHGDWAHLMANTLPFLVLGGLVILSSGRQQFVGITCIIAVVAGLGTWTFAAGGYHIGASSLIFGFLGFLLWRAWFGRNFGWTLIAILAGFLYGGIIISLFKSQTGISWSGHFFGLLGGIFAAFLYTPKPADSKSDPLAQI
ncbi:MAG: rhomboid family intramembrane serine protease [Verrucomicrobiales bacterium]